MNKKTRDVDAASLFIYKIAIKRWGKEARCLRFIEQSRGIHSQGHRDKRNDERKKEKVIIEKMKKGNSNSAKHRRLKKKIIERVNERKKESSNTL